MLSLTDAEKLALANHREESWRYDLLDLTDQKIGEMETAGDGSFDFSSAATIRSSGSLECQEKDIDWLKVRVQPWYTLKANGLEYSYPIGVFIPAAPVKAHSSEGQKYTVELYDKMLILNQDKVETTYTVASGVNVTDHIRLMLANVGETTSAVTDSDRTVKNDMIWEAGTTKLRIINDLLASINYFSIWADGYGHFRAAPYVEPARRGTAWEFVDDELSIYSPEFTEDEDSFNIPNKVVRVSTGSEEVEAMVAVATNEDPDSPYSYANRGNIWIVDYESEVEAADQETLDSIAERRLIELSTVSQSFEIKHAIIPLELNDVVRFSRDPAGIETRAVVQNMTISTGVGDLVTTNLRTVRA